MSRILFIFLFLIFGNLSATNPDNLWGTWMSTDNSVKVEVYKVNNQFKAKVLWFNSSFKREAKRLCIYL